MVLKAPIVTHNNLASDKLVEIFLVFHQTVKFYLRSIGKVFKLSNSHTTQQARSWPIFDQVVNSYEKWICMVLPSAPGICGHLRTMYITLQNGNHARSYSVPDRLVHYEVISTGQTIIANLYLQQFGTYALKQKDPIFVNRNGVCSSVTMPGLV